MADWASHDRMVRRRELNALRGEIVALQEKARGHQQDVGNRRAYTRVLAIIDRRIDL